MNNKIVGMGIGGVDVVFGVGVVLLAAGCWGFWGWPAAALCVGGVMVVLAMVGVRCQVSGGRGPGGGGPGAGAE